MRKILVTAMACAAFSMSARAEAQSPFDLSKGARINLDAEGHRYLRLMTWHQFWMSFNQNNPDSIVRGEPRENGFDVGIRRSRVLIQAMFSEDISLIFHFGINNQGTTGGGFGAGDTPKKPQLFIHDAWGQYRIYKEALFAGIGLHYWNGPLRLSNASTITFMTIDSPGFSWPTIEKTDQFGRQMGIFLKGKLEKFDYRLAFDKPFATTGTPAEDKADYYADANTLAAGGYFKYDFLEPENNILPYFVGTYIGKKKVWNIGGGFYYHPGSMAYLEGGELRRTDALLLGVDTYFELPFGKRGSAVTGYLGIAYYDFGPNYLRSFGFLNPSSGIVEGAPGSINGPGNAVPTVGTGATYYTQLGYLLPDVFGRLGRVQPYAQLRVSKFEALGDPVIVPEGGLNWFVAGHNAKLTINYRSRPVFTPSLGTKPEESARKSELTLQTQFFF